jgi:hypothetical protein
MTRSGLNVRFHMEDSVAIREQIRKAFSSVTRPALDTIAPHRCPECDSLRDALALHTAETVPLEILSEHVWDLPLLSAEAKHYYLPAWLYAALSTNDTWNFIDAAIGNIDSNERFDSAGGYTDEQWQAILSWLEYVQATNEAVTQESAHAVRAAVLARR